jgi:tryptophan 7-halogenase
MNESTERPVNRIVVVGGGSAGWLTAGLLAAEHGGGPGQRVSVTLVESPDVRTIGVGEGTWPTMRSSLQKIGISETEFVRECAASFKQGTRFAGWVTGAEGDQYHHPFTAPAGYTGINLVPYWLPERDRVTFVNAVSPQGYVCDRALAPKQATTPEFAGVANYGYHLDAGKFAALLQRHCTSRLGVRHVLDHVTAVNGGTDEDVVSLGTARSGNIEGDLFIDCTGFAAVLLGKHYGIPYLDRGHVLFNDSALALQVPYAQQDGPIASQTISTARSAGWIWDIGLTTRRGIGYTYSSRHTTDAEAEAVLRSYVAQSGGDCPTSLEPRKISFRPGHRAKFWHRNCVAIGMSAGFLEPLEASALVMIELGARMIGEELPAVRDEMDVVARRYNDRFLYRWERIIDFLKLHYVLSRRAGAYWTDSRAAESIPESLREYLQVWRHRVPWHNDFSQRDEVFSSASYQYVLYGMGFATSCRPGAPNDARAERARQLFAENREMAGRYLRNLPDHRALLTHILANGLPLAAVGEPA